ncbi:MAG: protein phosphatase 2C domain-containing protein [Alphaproteobacteria bacterium]
MTQPLHKPFWADGYAVIGYPHVQKSQHCQDDALALATGTMAFAVVSDGCSSVLDANGRDLHSRTDVGSRVVTHSMRKAVKQIVATSPHPHLAVEAINALQRAYMASAQDALSLDSADLTATCIYAFLTPQGGFVHVRGDGAVAIRYTDGKLLLHRFGWPPEMGPYYPINQEHPSHFIATHGGNAEATLFTQESWATDGKLPLFQSASRTYTVREGMDGVLLTFSAKQVKNLEAVAVFSDGVEKLGNISVSVNNPPFQPWQDVVAELMQFKAHSDAFVRNRQKRFLDFAANPERAPYKGESWVPCDDLSMAAIRLQHTE